MLSEKDGKDLKVIPQHVAIIMDGNGRWAKARHLPRVEGHRQGAKTVQMVVEESRRLGIRYLTLYTFSSENWNRPADEVSTLMRLFRQYLEKEVEQLKKNGIRLRAIGDLSRLPEYVQQALEAGIESTASNSDLDLILAVSYGGRDELLNAVQGIVKDVLADRLKVEDINSSCFQEHLYAPDLPDVDLLIRTSGENRISNFLLWQLAYAEIVVSPSLWPEFSKEDYLQCLTEFGRRNRRFGLTAEQVAMQAAKVDQKKENGR